MKEVETWMASTRTACRVICLTEQGAKPFAELMGRPELPRSAGLISAKRFVGYKDFVTVSTKGLGPSPSWLNKKQAKL